MKNLIATLIETNASQRFYRLSHKINKGIVRLSGREINIDEEIKGCMETFVEGVKKYVPKDGCGIICVSDATTHFERLVFVAIEYESCGIKKIGRTRIMIEGCYTMMTHGGDKRAMKADEVYLRCLARRNGFQFIQNVNN